METTAKQIGPQVSALACDVSDEQQVAAAFATLSNAGPIDGLVNSPGISHIGTLMSTSASEFDRLFAVNVRGSFLCMQRAVKLMQQNGGGVILNMASIAATSGLPDRFAYSMTKGAVLSMTLSVARDFLADRTGATASRLRGYTRPSLMTFSHATIPVTRPRCSTNCRPRSPSAVWDGLKRSLCLLFIYAPMQPALSPGVIIIDGGFFNIR